MPKPKFARKPGDLSSGATPKRRDITDADRAIVLTAILAGKGFLEAGRLANVTRFDAEAIAGAAGWPIRPMVEAARDRAKAAGA